MNIMIRNNGLL